MNDNVHFTKIISLALQGINSNDKELIASKIIDEAMNVFKAEPLPEEKIHKMLERVKIFEMISNPEKN